MEARIYKTSMAVSLRFAIYAALLVTLRSSSLAETMS